MKILMLVPYLPYPPFEGGQIRSYKLIKLLSEKHDITLVCFTRTHNTPDQIEHMKKYCKKIIVIERGKTWTLKNILRTGFSPYPFLINIYFSPQTRQLLAAELARTHYDLIHAEMFYTLPYLPEHHVPTILVEQTIMSRVFNHQAKTDPRLWFRPLMAIDILKMQFWEKYYWQRVDKLVTVSEEDAAVIRSMLPDITIDIVPNGVGEDFTNMPRSTHYNHTLYYMGDYKWIQNWEAVDLLAKKVFPLVKKAIPDAKLTIAGKFPTPQVRALAAPDIEVLEFKGNDGHSVVDACLKSGLFVAPMYAPGGTRLKILASMAAMMPVVTTPIGAEGYGAVNGQSILIGTRPEDLAEQAVRVLTNKKLYTKIATNARQLVDTKFTWGPIAKKLENIYEEVVHHHS